MSSTAFDADLIDYLQGDPTLNGIVGTNIYADTAPQAGLSRYIVFEQTSGTNMMHSEGPTRLVAAQYTFDCYARTPREARQIRDALKDRLHALSPASERGRIGTNQTEVESAYARAEQSFYTPTTAEGREAGQPGVTIEFDITYAVEV